MLNTIKSIITSKKAYMEATELIMENDELDDSIILDEKPDEEPVNSEEPELTDDEKEKVDKNIDDDLITGDEDKPEEKSAEPAEEPLPIPGSEEQPAATSGDELDDILTTEINIATNTQVDTLPVPPANASDAVEGDVMMQSIDSGFGGEDNPGAPIEQDVSIMDMDIDDNFGTMIPHNDRNKELKTEAVTMGDVPTEEPTEEPSEAPDTTSEEQPTENPVTAAVKDKVEEMQQASTTSTAVGGNKEEIMKKLSSLTKSIEDAKNLVMQSMQNE